MYLFLFVLHWREINEPRDSVFPERGIRAIRDIIVDEHSLSFGGLLVTCRCRG